MAARSRKLKSSRGSEPVDANNTRDADPIYSDSWNAIAYDIIRSPATELEFPEELELNKSKEDLNWPLRGDNLAKFYV